MANDPTNASLLDRHDLNENLSIVRVRPDSGRVPEFTPGQFITLGLPKTLPPQVAALRPPRPGRVPMTRRAYSIASSPAQTDALEFFVVLIEEGKLTPRMWSLDANDRLWMDTTAKGEFTLERAPAGKDLVMISTGTGIAPFVSMLRTFRGQQRWRRFVMINGVRHVSDLGYRDELESVCSADPTVCYLPLVSRAGDEPWDGLHGRVNLMLEPDRYQERVGASLDPAECHVFLCGNPAMIDETEGLLQARGFRTHTNETPGNIHFERYW